LRRLNCLRCAPNEICHAPFTAARVFKGDLVPPISGTREQGFTIEDAVAAEPGNRNPASLTAHLRDFFTVTENYAFHVSGY
jgi:hypothetical protein